MSVKRVKPEGLADAINDTMRQYDKRIVSGTDALVTKAKTELLREVKALAPVKTGTYKSAIATTKVSKGPRGIVFALYVRAPHYRLSHLLEKGHALHQGGRAKAKPHFAPAVAKVFPKLIKDIEELIVRGCD